MRVRLSAVESEVAEDTVVMARAVADEACACRLDLRDLRLEFGEPRMDSGVRGDLLEAALAPQLRR